MGYRPYEEWWDFHVITLPLSYRVCIQEPSGIFYIFPSISFRVMSGETTMYSKADLHYCLKHAHPKQSTLSLVKSTVLNQARGMCMTIQEIFGKLGQFLETKMDFQPFEKYCFSSSVLVNEIPFPEILWVTLQPSRADAQNPNKYSCILCYWL